VDGVYLDLHGAAITESLEDAEGDLLARVRRVVGPEVPVVASLDFHANVSPLMLKESDGLIAFRTYPHVDMAETGARAARFLLSLVAAGGKLAKAMRQPPCLISIVWQSTLMPPMAGLIAAMERLEAELGVTMSLLAGFPHADVHDGGPAILAYGDRAEEAAETLSRQFEAALPDFAGALHSPENAIAAARAAPGRGPALLIDTQDNPGGGGFGDTTGVLAALIAAKALNACLCLIADPDAAAAAHAAGEGALIRLALGGRSDGVPFRADWRVARLGDGRFTGEGPLTAGNRVDLGPMALLAHEGVSVVVVSRKMQAHDPAILRHLGVDPAGLDLLALKSSVHFRAAFGPMARAIYVVVAPGPVAADITTLPFRRLRSGVALSPGGPIFPGTARATP
jgi:microcystin degradation protein MlrC